MTESIDAKNDRKTENDITSGTLSTNQVGVWQFWTMKQSIFNPFKQFEELVLALQLFCRLTLEIYLVAPKMLVLFVSSKLWGGIETALLMHLSTQLLRIIEVGVHDRQIDASAMYMAIVNRLSCVVFVAILDWWTGNIIPSFRARVIHYYEIQLMRARLRLDLSTASDPDSQAKISAYDAWDAFETVISFITDALASVSQLALIAHASRSSGGPFFALLCIAKPLIQIVFRRSVWSQMFLVNLSNKHHQRMNALATLTQDQYRQDYITGNLGNHILEEYEKAKDSLGDTCTDEFWDQLEKRQTPFPDMLAAIASDLPMVYCAVNAILFPSKFSIASIAILQQSSARLRYSLEMIVYNSKVFQRQVTKLRRFYAASEKKIKMKDGDDPYPKIEDKYAGGMGLELKNVTFSYPGSKNQEAALKNLSLKIKPGQLVVIVGANGSGKSTIVKLLTRLYDPTSGTILIDDDPVQKFRSSDLRRATATFTQDHNLYPLSLYENIALGDPAQVSNKALVAKAAEQGGAAEFIAKLADGMDTILDPGYAAYTYNVPDEPDHPLQKQMEKLSKKIDISGGEKQRVVASRTFMHLYSGKVKFVAVDEPSSALDPEAEFQLFERLVSQREDKTMVFVTHRFGHLTKRADMIICMKDGGVVESGSHEDLMKLNGEYSKLYGIQADAFASSA